MVTVTTVKTGAKGNAKNISFCKACLNTPYAGRGRKVQSCPHQVAAHNSNGFNVKCVRRIHRPVVTSSHGGQSPLASLICAKFVPSPRLVCIETNPGPNPKGKKRAKANAAKKVSALVEKAMGRPSISRALHRAQGLVGKYNSRGNNFMSPQRVNHPSKFTARPKGVIGEIYSMPYREECLGAVSTSVAFAVSNQLLLNAGNSITFPWLGSIAPKFEYYRFKKLGLRFESSSGYSVASTNTALGTMLVNCNYDVLDPAFASQIEMEAYGGGKLVSEKEPNITFTHTCEPNGIRGGVAGGWRYVLPSTATSAAGQPYPASSSAHDYDIGLLQVASAGAQAASVAGRLYMCYQVDFANPKLVPGAPVGAVAHFSSIVPTTANNYAGAVLQTGATLGGLTLGVNTLTFPASIPGNYLVALSVAGSTSAIGALTQSPSAGAVGFNVITSTGVRDSVSAAASGNAGANVPIMNTATFTIGAAGGLITLSPTTLIGGNAMDLFVFSLPSSLLTVDEREQQEIDVLRVRADEQDRKIERLMGLLSPVSEEFDEISHGTSSSAPQLTRSTADFISEFMTRKSKVVQA